jgi:hypothetical protein
MVQIYYQQEEQTMKRYQALVIFLILLALACGNSNSGGGSASSGNQQEPEQEAPAEEAKTFKVGEDVQVGEVRWKFLEVEDLGKELKSDNQFIDAKTTSGKFVRVRFEVENQGTESASYAGVDLVDGKGRTFKPYDERFSFVPEGEGCVLEQLNPNLVKTCTEIFELPADATGLKVVAGDLQMFGTDEAQVDLGM